MGKLTKENTKREDESYFLRCACHGHLLNLTVFEEEREDPQGSLYLTLYGTDTRYAWANRIRQVWHLFRHGVGGGNEMGLHPDEALELGRKLVELAEKMEGKADE